FVGWHLLLMSISQVLRSLMNYKRQRARGIEFSVHRIARAEEIAAALDSAQASGATALNIPGSPLFFAHRRLIMDRAAAARLPIIYWLPMVAEEGGLLLTDRTLISPFCSLRARSK